MKNCNCGNFVELDIVGGPDMFGMERLIKRIPVVDEAIFEIRDLEGKIRVPRRMSLNSAAPEGSGENLQTFGNLVVKKGSEEYCCPYEADYSVVERRGKMKVFGLPE